MLEGLGAVLGVIIGIIIVAFGLPLIIFLIHYAYIHMFVRLGKALFGKFFRKKKNSKKKKSSNK